LQQPMTRAVSAAKAQAHPGSNIITPMTVLIVDDSSVNLKLYEKLIKNLGCSDTHCFNKSTEALTWVADHEVDLVVIDYKMASPNGLEAIELIRKMADKEHVPILMVTADQAKEVRRKALALGASDFLAHPVDPDEFTARLNNMLALRQSQKQLAETASWLADQVKAATAELLAREREMILTLSIAAERRDPETPGHLKRIARYCEVIARAAGLPKPQQELVLATAPLHDIGKIGLPDHILLKTGKLTPDEFAVMKQHTVIGYDILKHGRSSTMQMAAQIALTHHERLDGSGYPRGLIGGQIPVVGKICAISDVFDALTSPRPYKEARTMKEAIDEINAATGSSFDPEIVAAFNSALPEIANIKRTYPEERG
jgi:putative two-component system response regulator